MMARDVLTSQVIVSGRMTDAVTGAAPGARPAVALVRRADGVPVPGVMARVGADGHYALYADPSGALPPQLMALRVEATATGYGLAQAAVDFTAADLARTTRTLDLQGPVAVPVIGGVPVRRDMALAPLPVALSGRTVDADDHGRPIAGATVAVTAPMPLGPVSSDADGWFTLAPLPVAASVTLSVTAPGYHPMSATQALDFSNPINRRSFALEPN